MTKYLHRKPQGVSIIKRTFVNEKRYTPVVRGKTLRLSWNTRTRAEVYGAMILDRYVKKLAILAIRSTPTKSKPTIKGDKNV